MEYISDFTKWAGIRYSSENCTVKFKMKHNFLSNTCTKLHYGPSVTSTSLKIDDNAYNPVNVIGNAEAVMHVLMPYFCRLLA
jgi:hypothetical protein